METYLVTKSLIIILHTIVVRSLGFVASNTNNIYRMSELNYTSKLLIHPCHPPDGCVTSQDRNVTTIDL